MGESSSFEPGGGGTRRRRGGSRREEGAAAAGCSLSALAEVSLSRAVAVAQALKSELLACIEAEPERGIRKKACDAVGQLGVTLLNEDPNSWPELLPFMLGAAQSGNVNMHEASLVIFNALSDFIAEKMKPHHGMLLDVFRSSLQRDQQLMIRVAALKGAPLPLRRARSPSGGGRRRRLRRRPRGRAARCAPRAPCRPAPTRRRPDRRHSRYSRDGVALTGWPVRRAQPSRPF